MGNLVIALAAGILFGAGVTVGQMVNPEKVITRPSPSVVTVGYQRPCAMFCTPVKTPVVRS